jgi:hypothetical protein
MLLTYRVIFPLTSLFDHSQVGIFESEKEEFVIPVDRYVWRLQCLEEAIRKGHGHCEGIDISTYFEDDEMENLDADFILYQGRLEGFAQRDVESQDLNLNNCGYESIRIGYDWPQSTLGSCCFYCVQADKFSSHGCLL